MWVVVEVVTSCLNPFVSTYVMKQSRGHWLLLNILIIAIALTMSMETTLMPLFGEPEIFDLFENEILVLHRNMWLEVIKVCQTFFVIFENF